jgi:hypothetical protein
MIFNLGNNVRQLSYFKGKHNARNKEVMDDNT